MPAGFPVMGFDIDAAKIADAQTRGELPQAPGRGICRRNGRPPGGSTPPTTSAATGRSGRGDQCASPRRWAVTWSRTSASSRIPPTTSPRRCGPGQLVVLESTTYPRHDPRSHAAALRSQRPASAARIFSSPTPPSAKIPAARTTTRRPSPSWSAASTPSAAKMPPRSTGRPSSRSSPSPPPRSPRPPSCWKTSTAPSTSPWSTR